MSYSASITYTYDSINRLANIDYGNGVTINYSYDAAGNRLTLVSTPSDTTPPTTPLVTDGGLYTTNLTQLHATWAANDPESGIREYQYAIGTTPQGTDVVGWTSAGISNAVSHGGLNLTAGVTYFISVKARNWVDLWSDVGTSDGILALSPAEDADGDGLTNGQEVDIYGTDPFVTDSDGDGFNDGAEVLSGTDPLDPASLPNRPPVALAGADQNILINTLVTLDGSASSDPDGDLITYQWAEAYKPAGSTAELSDPTVPKPTFTPDLDGSYQYDLVACDTYLACSGPDSVVITAAIPNVPPNANAGPDQNVLTGLPVLLNGTASNDPDNGPNAMTYLWGFLNVPTGSLLTDADIAGKDTRLPTFVPDAAGDYQFDLAVWDGADATHDQVLITANENVWPTANAGLDQMVPLGQAIVLDGSGSYDQDGLPQPMTYQWSFVSLPAGSGLTNASLTGAATVSPSFTPDIAGSYVLQLGVSDGQAVTTDNVVVTVDSAGPTGSLVINGNAAWTNTTSVILTVTCTDDPSGSGCAQMRISNDGVFDTEPFEAYASSKNWTLLAGSGTRTVYVRYKDGVGNLSSMAGDNIKLDTAKPTLSNVSDTPDPLRHHLGEVSTISFTAADNLSGTCTVGVAIFTSGGAEVRRIIQNGVSCPSTGAAGSLTWDGRANNGTLVPAGTYTYKLLAGDKANNRSAIKQGTVAVE